MTARLAYAYVRLLWVLEVVLFAASLLLHLSVFITGTTELYAAFGLMLFRATVIVGVPVIGFTKGRWTDQIKTCPKLMWKCSLILGVYALFLIFLAIIFPQGTSLSEDAFTLSGVPLGFDAISLCVYSVLWSGYLEKSEVVRQALYSVAFVGLTVIMFLFYRAGYLHHPRSD